MEAKLAEYRARKKREQLNENAKNKLYDFLPKRRSITMDQKNEEEEVSLINSDSDETLMSVETQSETNEVEEKEVPKDPRWLRILKIVIYTVLWLTLFVIFVKLEFAVIFLIVSALVGVYLNTRTGPKKAGEISAYSVFNKGCESIEGTLKAEQFERELMYGPGSLR